jgi:hypothetical protein
VLYASEVKTAWGGISAAATLGGVPFQVEASYDSSLSGWEFKGCMAPEKPLAIAAFIDKLFDELGVHAKCPPALANAEIDVLSVSINTATTACAFCCSVRLPLSNGKELDIALLVDIASGSARFDGSVTLGSMVFDLIFDQTPDGKTLVASFADAEPTLVTLGELVAMVSGEPGDFGQGQPLAFSVNSALFVLERKGAEAQWLLAADVQTRLDFGGLPLVGASFAPGQGARLLFQPLLTSGGVDTGALAGLVHEGGLTLPATAPAKGLSLTTRVSLGAEVIPLGLPLAMRQGEMVHDASVGSASASAPAPGVATVDDASWIAVQKAFGPLALERVGVRFQDGALHLLLDAHLSVAGLTLGLEGFGARVDLAHPSHVNPVLDGIGIDFRSPTLQIGGSLLRQPWKGDQQTVDEYLGTAVVRTAAFSIDAIGSYRTVDGQPSLFVYASLDYPIGGPAFFFVTGLAAAFGYNRSFKLPPIDQLAGFPLLAAGAGKPLAPGGDGLRDTSAKLRPYIPAEVGAVFLGVGVRFNSFKTIESSALLTASFGRDVSFDLIGRSTLIMPAGATREQAVALIEMAWLASYRPADGLLALQAQLSPESYVFSKDCHLTGGFAFHSWFSGEHEGDFVLTAGGYHPRFDLASRPHYPRVPRLGVAWKVSDALSIKGDAYYALTSSAAMAGGHLEMVWEQFPYKAWCKAGIDCLFDWKPLHYVGDAYVELGVSYTLELGGTRHITVEVGADLSIWGPPFSGTARVNMSLFSFDVSFGSKKAPPAPVHLFDHDAKTPGTGFSAMLPDVRTLCAVSVVGGLEGSGTKNGEKVWRVNAKALRLVVDSAIPSKVLNTQGMATAPPQAGAKPEAVALSRFGIAPMAAGHDAVTSSMTITVTKRVKGGPDRQAVDIHWKPVHFQYRPRIKGYPAALWGEPQDDRSAQGSPKDAALVQAFAGVDITTVRAIAEGAEFELTGKVRADAARAAEPGDTATKVRLFASHRPLLEDGVYDLHVTQSLGATPHGAPHNATCCKPLVATASLCFQVGSDLPSLPASCIHSVYPPKGSLGTYAHTLPQVILDRSTLPWERSAGTDKPGDEAPWLALLVFDGERKATVQPAIEGTPETATIHIDAHELPSAQQRTLLCHVRAASERQPDGSQQLVERAVVLGQRTPTPGKRSTVHLVSMDGIKKDGARYELISLSSWTFSCGADDAGFRTLLNKADKAAFTASSARLAHALDSGQRAQADYRGPLVPLSRAVGDPPWGGVSDAQDDISQLAALELGRLLALKDKSVSVGLLRLKRSLSHQTRLAEQAIEAPHVHGRALPRAAAAHAPAGSLAPPLQQLLAPALAAWTEGLLRLEGVPFRYLLPDESMLPKESMRFFEVDAQWVTNLFMGALGVGGAWHLGPQARQGLGTFEASARAGRGPLARGEQPFGALPRITGVVLRSEVVSGWPALTVHAGVHGKTGDVAPCRTARLSKNILMVLFEGRIESAVFRLPQETLHFNARNAEPLAGDWLGHAKTLAEPVQLVDLADHEEVRCSWT